VPAARRSMAVDPDGNVYLAGDDGLHKFSPTGASLWTRPVTGVPGDGVYGVSAGAGFRVGLVVSRPDGSTGTDLFDAQGAPTGRSPVVGTYVTVDPSNGDILSTDGHFVRIYDARGELRSSFGSALEENAAGPFHFRLMGGAVRAGDGTVYLTNGGAGVLSFTSDGLYRGVAADRGPVGTITQGATLELFEGRVYYATGEPFAPGQGVSWLSTQELEDLVTVPKGAVPRLGIGAGLGTSAPGNYFAPGRTPDAHASFEPWWTVHARDLRGEYTVRERGQVLAGAAVTPKGFRIPATGQDINVPLSLPAAEPGYYEVEARLLKGDTVVGADCLRYSVGAPGTVFSFADLPEGADFGGAKPARAVALAEAMGFELVRGSVDWRLLLPDPASDGPLDFSAYDAELRDAARRAAASGVTFEVQVGGNPTEKALVEKGTWARRVRELVEHFKGDVHVWEAWNEPNVSFGPADRYVSQVLEPFFRAVKAADPTALVVGGSVLGLDLPYWEAVATAGGLRAMDVVAIHPYTGHNRSFEEHGAPETLRRLKELLASHGAGAKPIWNTESAWWSDGPANFYSQADKLVRAHVLLKDAGVDKWAYFITEGGYGDFGLSYSLIETATGTNAQLLKPAALAALTYRRMVGGRPLVRMLDTGAPHTYAALFGPAPGRPSPDTVVVAWADDYTTGLRLRPGAAATSTVLTVTDVMGGSATVPVADGQAALEVDGSPRYVTLPGTGAPEIAAEEAFGPDRALATAGGRATATSETARNPASAAIDGVSDAGGGGEVPELSAWAQAPGDARPSLTVTLPAPTDIDRVLVSTHSLGSVVTGLRSYDVQVRAATGEWATVARVRDQFLQRRHLSLFPATTATDVRLTNISVNYGGYAGGARPAFWPRDRQSLEDASSAWYGPALVYELSAYGPGGSGDHR
jgi:hypothetical protein